MGWTLDQETPQAPTASKWTLDTPPQAPAVTAATPTEPGSLESLGRGALQGATLGFSDELTGAIESLFTDKSYKQARDEARQANEAAKSAHPWLYGGGELAGGVASSVVPGAVLGKAAALAGEGTALARGISGAKKVADLATGVIPEGAGIGSVAARSAITGGVAGLGTSNADTLTDTAKDVGTGAALGGIVGGALHGIGSKVAGKSQSEFENNLNADIFKKARPKDYNQAVEVQKANPEAFKEMVYSKDFAPVQKLARAGKTEEALDKAEDFVNKAGANRLKNYEQAAADGYVTNPGSVIDRMNKVASYKAASGAPEEAKAISKAARQIKNEFSTVDTSLIKEGDTVEAEAFAKLKPYLPDRKTLTKVEFQDAATQLAKKESGNPKATFGDVSNDIASAIDNLPFKFDPNASIDLVHLRKAATNAQNATKSTLGSIAETEHHRIVHAVDQTINAALDAHLDAAAKTSPAAQAAVDRIRHDNKIISMGLSMRDALETMAKKESLGKAQTIGDKALSAFKNIGHLGGLGAAVLGANPIAGVAIAAAPHVMQGAAKVARAGNDQLARFIQAAKLGNPFAQKTLDALSKTPGGAARIAALMNGSR